MSRDHVQVFIRTRPTNKPAKQINVDEDGKSIHIDYPKLSGVQGGVNNQQQSWSFSYDSILRNSSQQATYDAVAQDIVHNALKGYNGTIMAYGQTGAGKTFTMIGPTSSYDARGIVPRALSQVFRHVQSHPEQSINVKVSYMEIYNEHIYDLLLSDVHMNAAGHILPAPAVDLQIQEDNDGTIHVKNLSLCTVNSESDALNYLFQGELNRTIARHDLNENSTRSHCIFTIYLETRSRIESSEKVVYSKLHLVDLAGSERVSKTGSVGLILNEAKYINRSLSFLEQVVVALIDKGRDHIPARQSRLTHVLKDSLGGNCKTRLIANIFPEQEHLDETISTLKFGSRMRKVSNHATINVVLDPKLLIEKQAREIKELKQELKMYNIFNNKVGINYEAFTPEEQAAMRDELKRFVRNEIDEVEIINLRQMKELLRQFKNIYLEVGRSPSPTSSTSVQLPPLNSAPTQPGDMVGDEEDGFGFGVGIVHNEQKPAPRADPRDEPLRPQNIKARRDRDLGKTSGNTPAAINSSTAPVSLVASPVASPPARVKSVSKPAAAEEKSNLNQEQIFEDWKLLSGRQRNDEYQRVKAEWKQKKQEFKNISIKINQHKHTIDELNVKIQETRRQREQDATIRGVSLSLEILDEDEYADLTTLANSKQAYANLFTQRNDLQHEVEYLEQSIDAAKRKLMEEFFRYYEATYGISLDPTASSSPVAAKSQLASTVDLTPEQQSFMNATRNLSGDFKKKTLHFGARRPNVKSSFK